MLLTPMPRKVNLAKKVLGLIGQVLYGAPHVFMMIALVAIFSAYALLVVAILILTRMSVAYEQNEPKSRFWVRLAVVILIVVIATGGYFGYWWLQREPVAQDAPVVMPALEIESTTSTETHTLDEEGENASG